MRTDELSDGEQIDLAVVIYCAEERTRRGTDKPQALLCRDAALRLHDLGLVTWEGAPELLADRVACVPLRPLQKKPERA